jgi:hypothetical protein
VGKIAVAVQSVPVLGQAVEHGWLQIGYQPHFVDLVHVFFPCTDVSDERNAAVGFVSAGRRRETGSSVI